MRAGRLLRLVLLLQNRGRITAQQLARELEVSERTVLRDIDALSSSGVPVYAVRGPGGGFEMLDTFEQSLPPLPPGLTSTPGQLRRVRVRVTPAALQLAAMSGRPEGWRARPNAEPDPKRPDWIEGSFRFDSYDTAVRELTALAPDIEVLLPAELRETMAEVGRRMTRMHSSENERLRAFV